jgi:hypothetical protein
MSLRATIAGASARVFGLDVRSLAALRIALGALLLVDLSVRASDFSAMYVDQGIAPVRFVRQHMAAGEWSLHVLNGAPAFQAALFAAAAILAVALTIGYRTRLATILSWVLLASLHVRLPIVLNAGDTLLRLLLFWGMFLPLGAAWSVDARRRGSQAIRAISPVASAATFALIVQLSLVYWFAGLAKWNESWLEGDALGQIFSFTLYSQPAGHWLNQFPELTSWLSRAVVALELFGPCLLYLPWQTPRWRMIAAFVFASLHLGIAATITVGIFPWVGLAAWLALIPGQFWDRIGIVNKRNRPSTSPVPPLSPPFKGGGLITACVFASLALVLYCNFINHLHRIPAPRLHALLRPVANATMLRQAWPLFGEPMQYDAWFVYLGRLNDGRRIDLRTGEPVVDEDQPADAWQRFPNHRWRKLHMRLPWPRYAAYRQPLAGYVCRRWNENHGPHEQAVRLDLYCLRLPVTPDNSSSFVRQSLAQVLLDPSEGNFADALRELVD